jgi:hypothetical protein
MVGPCHVPSFDHEKMVVYIDPNLDWMIIDQPDITYVMQNVVTGDEAS